MFIWRHRPPRRAPRCWRWPWGTGPTRPAPDPRLPRPASPIRPAAGVLILLLSCLAARAGLAADSLRCAACGQEITGTYVTALDRTWHPEHFACAGCGRALAGESFLAHDGAAYCPACYHERFSARCAICAQPLTTAYAEDAWGNRYHPRHTQEVSACSSCGRLICSALTRGGVRYGDGRALCTLCRATSVDEAGAAGRLLEQVRAGLVAAGLPFVQPNLPVRLVSLQDLSRLAGNDRAHGRTQTVLETRHGRVVARRIEEITILYGLPAEHFCAVAAHELGHVYLFEQGFADLPRQVEEGVCELLSCLWLGTRAGPEAAFHAERKRLSDDPLYGAGLRSALDALQGRSLAEVLDHVRQHRAFPDPLPAAAIRAGQGE
ncbi:MAG: protein DA1 [Candidatus Latescibacterota bacterium]